MVFTLDAAHLNVGKSSNPATRQQTGNYEGTNDSTHEGTEEETVVVDKTGAFQGLQRR